MSSPQLSFLFLTLYLRRGRRGLVFGWGASLFVSTRCLGSVGDDEALVWVVWRGVYVGSSVWWEVGTVRFACGLRVGRSRRSFCWGRRTFGPDCCIVLMRGLVVIFCGGVFVCVAKKNFRRFLVCLSFLLMFDDLFLCVQIMVSGPVPTNRFLMERILRAARLQFSTLSVGVEGRRILRVYFRWLRRSFALDSPWMGRTARRLNILRIMTVWRTSGFGKCSFKFDFKLWVLLF